VTWRPWQKYTKKTSTQKVCQNAVTSQTFLSSHVDQMLLARSYPEYLSWLCCRIQKVRLRNVGAVGVEILAFALTWHIAYTTHMFHCSDTSNETSLLSGWLFHFTYLSVHTSFSVIACLCLYGRGIAMPTGLSLVSPWMLLVIFMLFIGLRAIFLGLLIF